MQFDAIRFQPSRPLLKEVSADRLNAIVAEIKKNRIKGERGISVRHSGDATFVGLSADLKTALTETLHPFKINSLADGDNFTVTVEPGVINNILPSNVFNGGVGLTEFSVPADSLRYVCLAAQSSDGVISSCTLSVDSAIPPQQTALANALPASFKVLLGVVYNGTVKQVATNNLRAYGTILFNTYNGTQNRDWYVWTWSNA